MAALYALVFAIFMSLTLGQDALTMYTFNDTLALCNSFDPNLHIFVCPEGPTSRVYIDCHMAELVHSVQQCPLGTLCGLMAPSETGPCNAIVPSLPELPPPGTENITAMCEENTRLLGLSFGYSCFGGDTSRYVQCVDSEASVRKCPVGTTCIALDFGAAFPCLEENTTTRAILRICRGHIGYACLRGQPGLFLQCGTFLGAVHQCAPGTTCAFPTDTTPISMKLANPCRIPSVATSPITVTEESLKDVPTLLTSLGIIQLNQYC
ncbi:hypothetical protein Pelo_5282 [Pelomyxa schiedti]|nr:hypothetical protein Pelo_5282 [Pelomyxa schiedti]